MHSHPRPPIVLAQDAGSDRRRDAGLRGEDYDNAVVGLTAVFLVGLAVLALVVISGRRRRRS